MIATQTAPGATRYSDMSGNVLNYKVLNKCLTFALEIYLNFKFKNVAYSRRK